MRLVGLEEELKQKIKVREKKKERTQRVKTERERETRKILKKLKKSFVGKRVGIYEETKSSN